MLKQLFPKLYQRYLSSPLLGPILDGYEDWLSDRKYTRKTRRLYMRMALLVDQHLQELGLVRILVIPITCTGFIRSPDLPNSMS